MASSYWQIEVDEADKEKTAFISFSGLYEFNVLPFGLCNGPATFQRLMEIVLAGLQWKTCLVYIDDILLFSSSFSDHLVRLEQIFTRLREANLKLKLKKCKFGLKRITFLGHLITSEGVAPDPDKVKAITEIAEPTKVEELRSFLGLASYYRKFIRGFSEVAAPLTALLHQGTKFCFDQNCKNSFLKLKDLLVSSPILVYPDFSNEFTITTDASCLGLGAVLSQQRDCAEHPVHYASRTLLKSEKNYTITELEALGVVWAVKYFRQYLAGKHFTIVTDHAALKWLMTTDHSSQRLTRWRLCLQEYDFDIIYRAGKSIGTVDGLSRLPREVNATHSIENDMIITQQRQDPSLHVLIAYLQADCILNDNKMAKVVAANANQYILENGVLYFLHHRGKNTRDTNFKLLVIPKALQTDILKLCHSDLFGGHFGVFKTFRKLRDRYFWEGQYRDVENFCSSCEACLTRKRPRAYTRAPLQPLQVHGPFDRIAMDFMGPFNPPSDHGNKYIIVFSDYLTKWVEAFPTRDQKDARQAKRLSKQIIDQGKKINGVSCDSIWYEQGKAVRVMRELLAEKFANPGFRQFLLATESSMLVEVNPYDTYWGAGLSKKELQRLTSPKFPGENWMGHLLMEIRGRICDAMCPSVFRYK